MSADSEAVVSVGSSTSGNVVISIERSEGVVSAVVSKEVAWRIMLKLQRAIDEPALIESSDIPAAE